MRRRIWNSYALVELRGIPKVHSHRTLPAPRPIQVHGCIWVDVAGRGSMVATRVAFPTRHGPGEAVATQRTPRMCMQCNS